MKKNKILDLTTRRKIYKYISENPGVHLRKISRTLDLKIFNLYYHIKFLKKQGLIFTIKKNGYLRCFISNSIGNGEKKLLILLRQKTTRDIILSILWSWGLSSKELCKILNRSGSTIDFHLKKLIKNNIIEPCVSNRKIAYIRKKHAVYERGKNGREIVYYLKNAKIVYNTFTIYQDSLLDDATLEIFSSIDDYYSKIKPKRINTIDDCYDTVIDSLYDVFPHPYHC